MKVSFEFIKKVCRAAEHGDAEAQYLLGGCYYKGEGVAKDKREAVKWYRKAAKQEDVDAQYRLGRCYYFGEGVAKDKREAVKWWHKSAEQGEANAQFNLGVCYERGEGVAEDEREAIRWYRKAAEQGIANAQFKLGMCYKTGEGVAEDEREAMKWLRKAVEQGHRDALFVLAACYKDGEGVEIDRMEFVKMYREAAEQGDIEAQFKLGCCYCLGEGVAEDKCEAVKWFRKAADQGYSKAQCMLGIFYNFGDGVAENKQEAIKWFRKAAEQGNADAQFELGMHYNFGYDVKEDKQEAVKWYRKAAESGDLEVLYNMARYYYRDEETIAEGKREAVKWWRKAAEIGYMQSQYKLGICYYFGIMVAKDKREAIKWLRKSAEQGFKEAQQCLKILKDDCIEQEYGIKKEDEVSNSCASSGVPMEMPAEHDNEAFDHSPSLFDDLDLFGTKQSTIDKPQTCVIYTRFSPRLDADKSQSCNNQRSICINFAIRNGWKVRAIFDDPDRSGADEYRNKLWDAIKMLKKGESLVVVKRDRLARDLYLMTQIERMVEKRGGCIVAVEGDTLTNTAEDKLRRHLLDVVAEYERKLISMRTKSALREMFRKGNRVGGLNKVVYGYSLDPNNSDKIIPNPKEQEAIKLIMRLRDEGKTYREIIETLPPDASRTGRWHYTHIRNIVERETRRRMEAQASAD